ncbi:MAG: DinB family protein [Bacteroidota bacterium]
MLTKKDISSIPPYYQPYVDIAPDQPIIEALRSSGIPIIEVARDRWKELGDKRYATGKWTVKEVIQHCIDTERVFAYRAMRIGRNDTTVLPGFDQHVFATHADVSELSVDRMIKELIIIRQSSIYLFEGLSAEAMCRRAIASGTEQQVLLIGFLIAGHLLHHQQVIEDRYYPLLA